MNASAKAIAERFVEARRTATGLPQFPGEMPTALDAAYGIQDEAIALAGDRVIGWKVGLIKPPLDAQFGADRLAGPIFTARNAGDDDVMPIFAAGFAAAEAEFMLRIGTPPQPNKTEFTLTEATDHIDAVHLGIEVASSPFPGINDHGPTVTVADFGNNYGLLIGDAIEDWRSMDFVDRNVVSCINGEEVGTASASGMPDGPFGAARFLFELLGRRGIALKSGDWISSGAVTGVHPVSTGDRFRVRFDGCDVLECGFDAARSRS